MWQLAADSANSLVSQRKATGILGMVFAVAGGIAWIYSQALPALILWGVAVLIILKNNKSRKQRGR